MPRIFLAQANDRVAVPVKEALEAKGMEVEFFHLTEYPDRIEKLIADAMEAYSPDLVIFEISHPFRESWQAFERIRNSSPELSYCPYLIVTLDKDILSNEAGTVPYIEIRGIPFDPDEVVRAATQVLKGHGHPRMLRTRKILSRVIPKTNVE